jgi:hypothetical protein
MENYNVCPIPPSDNLSGVMRGSCTMALAALVICVSARSEPVVGTCDVKAIGGYAKQIEANLKQFRVRSLTGSGAEGKPGWREANRLTGASQIADVYLNDAQAPIAAFFTTQTESGDWILYTRYYFRPDGSLAKEHERLNTFHGNASVIRDTFFGCRGELLRAVSQHLDLKTQKPKKPAPDFLDEESPSIKHVRDLYFLSWLLNLAP